MAISRPEAARVAAVELLSGHPSLEAASYAHQALAIVHRDRGQTTKAISHGRTALRLARRVGDERQADVLATLGVALVLAGRSGDGLARLAEAIPLTPPARLPQLYHRRGYVLSVLGRTHEALEDLSKAVSGSHDLSDTLWEGRARNARAENFLSMGLTAEADADAREAGRLFTSIGQEFEAAQATHNRALAAHQRGDLPEALRLLDDVSHRYDKLDVAPADLVIDHAQALMTAGLMADARAMSAHALANRDLSAVRRAEFTFVVAKASLALGDTASAAKHASAAVRLFAAQGRVAWRDRARLLQLRARFVADHPMYGPWMLELSNTRARDGGASARRSKRLLDDVATLVHGLRTRGGEDLPVALVLHARMAAEVGLGAEAEASLEEAAATRHQGPPLSRAAGWLAAALLADHRHDRRALYLACRRGLDAVDEHRSILGDLELRALASGHGIEFSRLAISEAVRSARPRDVFWWAERWRGAALRDPVTRPMDASLRQNLAALRAVTRRLDTIDADDPGVGALTRERSRLESTIRAAHRHVRAASLGERRDAPSGTGSDLDSVLAELGADGALVNVIRDGDMLHLIVVAGRRARHHVIGPSPAADRESDFARFALRRAAYGRTVDLRRSSTLLQEALLGNEFALPPGVRRVVVVPPAELLNAPWGLLPAFADAVVSVSPSVSQWVRAQHHEPRGTQGITLVTGPHLTTRESEVAELSRLHRHATVLRPHEATAAASLAAIDGASLAHIAAHGFFRADAPLFSSFALADGPLTVHEFRQLENPPDALVLSACDSGGAAPIGSYEALGLVSTLLGMGSRALLAALVPVNDQATLTVMAHVHRTVASGGTLAEGWLAARQAAGDDPLLAATASSFTAWGA
jgi:tetratricopeptide (TPR) repeat protein